MAWFRFSIWMFEGSICSIREKLAMTTSIISQPGINNLNWWLQATSPHSFSPNSALLESIWCYSLPCKPWSVWQNINHSDFSEQRGESFLTINCCLRGHERREKSPPSLPFCPTLLCKPQGNGAEKADKVVGRLERYFVAPAMSYPIIYCGRVITQ